MAKVLSSISGNLISAASAGFAPTNSADVSAIASGYQVVSATATQLYAGTAYLTSVNGDPISASRAGNAANASMANSAYYDGTGRLISALPDSAAVSSIASSYAESAASGKLDSTAQVVSSTAGDGTYVTSINGMGISGQGGGGAQVVTATGSASAMEGWWPPFTTSYLVSSINGSALLPYGYSALSGNSGKWNTVYSTVNSNSASWGAGASIPITGSAGDVTATYEVEFLSFVRNDTAGEPDIRTASLGTDQLYIDYTLDGIDHTSMSLTESMLDFMDSDGDHIVDAHSIDSWNSAVNTVANNSASWGQGGVDSATVSAIASSYAGSAASSKQDSSAMSAYALSSDVSGCISAVSANSASWAQGFQYGNSGSYNTNTIGIGASGAGTKTDAGIYLTSTHGTGFYKVNEMTLNRSGYGETVNFNLGSAGSQVRVSASGSRGGYFSAWNDNMSAALMVSGSKPVLKLGAELATDSSISSWNDCYDTVSANSASWAESGVDSATVSAIASSYAESAVSSVSGNYAQSADVSATVDLVSTQSANWGGSALALSAGPGVKLEKVGNTLVASTDETVLYSATAYAPGDTQQSYTLNETPMNYETVRVFAYRPLGNGAPWFGSVDIQIENLYNYTASNKSIAMPYAFVGTSNNIFYEGQYFINNITSTSWEDGSSTQRKTTETAYTTGYYAHIYKIIGINRTAGV